MMRKRNELPKLDDSLFKKIENRKLSFIVGGTSKGSTSSQVLVYKVGYVTQIDD